jgi:hypothetical protein
MSEDELWSPVVLCQAEKMLVVDLDFYYYRQRKGSVMHTTSNTRYLDSLFRVLDRLMKFADRYDFTGKDAELKNWLYVHIFWLYSWTFNILSNIKNSSYIVPKHHLDRFWRDCHEMMPEPQGICRDHFQKAEQGLKKYTDWRISDRVAPVKNQLKEGRKLLLVYNILPDPDEELKLTGEAIPAGWAITTDRHYFRQAHAVVFHLPSLYQVLENELEKPEAQIWISWYLESETGSLWVENPEIAVFDHWICYQTDDEQQEHPLVQLFREIDCEKLRNTNKLTAKVSMQDYLSHANIADLCRQIDLPGEVTENVLKHAENDDFTALNTCFGDLFSSKTAERAVKVIETFCSEQKEGIDHG